MMSNNQPSYERSAEMSRATRRFPSRAGRCAAEGPFGSCMATAGATFGAWPSGNALAFARTTKRLRIDKMFKPIGEAGEARVRRQRSGLKFVRRERQTGACLSSLNLVATAN